MSVGIGDGDKEEMELVRAVMRGRLLSTVANQRFFEEVHAWALRGMGIGAGEQDFEQSGEAGVVERELRKNPRPIIFDVGAYRGDWARMARARLGGRAEIHCFEPNPAAALGIGGEQSGLCVHPYALSACEGSATLHVIDHDHGLASLSRRRLAHVGLAIDRELRVTTRRIDDVCREQCIDRIALLKIDAEGHELAVLAGAKEMLERGAIAMIQWEMGGCCLDARTTLQDFFYLLSGRYDIARVVRDGCWPIAYREAYEIFAGPTNYLAVLR